MSPVPDCSAAKPRFSYLIRNGNEAQSSAVQRRAAAASPVHHERRGPEKTTLYRLVQGNLETLLVRGRGGASLPQFVNDEFETFLKFGIMTALRNLRCLLRVDSGNSLSSRRLFRRGALNANSDLCRPRPPVTNSSPGSWAVVRCHPLLDLARPTATIRT